VSKKWVVRRGPDICPLPQQSLSETEPVQVCTDLFLFEGLAVYRKQARRERIDEPEPVVGTLNLGY
jgi:hypothetical protein